jgi:hypothetical protein
LTTLFIGVIIIAIFYVIVITGVKTLAITNGLILALEQKQREGNYTDRQFARKLQVSRSTWYYYRTHPDQAMRIFSPLIIGVMKQYPEMEPQLKELLNEAINQATMKQVAVEQDS